MSNHEPSKEDMPGPSLANVLVVLALAAMLVGAVLLLLARDHTVVTLSEGQEAVVVDASVPGWSFGGQRLELRVTSNATTNVTVSFDAGTGESRQNTSMVRFGDPPVVHEERAGPGEAWAVRVENEGPCCVRVSVTVTDATHQWVGGGLVAFGVLGFVFHRLGMRRHGG